MIPYQDLSQPSPSPSSSESSDSEQVPAEHAAHRPDMPLHDKADGLSQTDLLEALSVVSRRSMPPQTRMRQLRQLLRRRPAASRYLAVRPLHPDESRFPRIR